MKSLRIQSVLFRNGKADVNRSLMHLWNSVRVAQQANMFSQVFLALGDCSPTAVFTNEEVEALHLASLDYGVSKITYDFFGANLGSAGGHNRLLKDLSTDYALILNPDTLVASDLFVELVKPFSDPRVAVVEAKQIPLEHPKDYDEITGDTGWVSTACAMVLSSAIKEVNGFDADTFFLYCDDVDFSWRLRLLGHRLVFQPSAAVFHDKRLSITGEWMAGDAERYHAALAAMLLAHKYSRSDLAKRIFSDLSMNGDMHQKKAALDYSKRESEGILPNQLDPQHKVAQFLGGFYAPHRF